MAKNRVRHTDDDEQGDQPPAKSGGSRLVWFGSRLVVVFVLLGVLAFVAPILIGSTGAWKSILASSAPKLAGKIDAKSVTLSWLAPIELSDVAVRDAAGEPLAQIARVKSRKTLLAIALCPQDLGTFDIEQPQARVALRDTGSNVEEFLTLLPESKQDSPRTQIGLAVTGGTIEIDDQIAGKQWLLSRVNLDLLWTAAADQPKTGKLSCAIANASGAVGNALRGVPPGGNVPPGGAPAPNPGQLAAEFSWLPPADGKTALGAGQASLALSNVPAEASEGALRRYVGDIRANGPVTLEATYVWAQDGQSQQANVKQLTTSGLSLAAPQWLGADRPTLVVASGQGDVQYSQGTATVRNLALVSNLVEIRGDGQANIGALASGGVQLAGKINLPEVCRQLPATIRLKPGTNVNSGELRLALSSQPSAGGRAWQGAVELTSLRATVGGRAVEFQQPLAIELGAEQRAGGLAISKLAGGGEFFDLSGSGTLAGGAIHAHVDLNKLAAQLGQFIDLGSTRMAGLLHSDIRWQESPATGWTATAAANVQNFELAAAGLAPWKEADLKLAAEVRGALDGAALERIDVARLTVAGGADQLVAELQQPVTAPSAATAWPLKFSLRGDLATWTPRLQPFLPLGDLRLAGAIDAAGSGRFSPQAVELAQTSISIEPFTAQGAGLAIREPRIKIDTAGAWDQDQATLTLGTTTFASSSLAFRADGLRVIAGNEPSVVGVIDLRGDLAKLHGWLDPGPQPRTSQLSGALTGRVEIGYRGQTLAATWQSDIENFALLVAPSAGAAGGPMTLAASSSPQTWQPLLPPERVNLSGQGTYDPATSTLKIDRTSLTASTLSLAAAGSVKHIAATPEVDLTGEIAYDLERLAQQIQAFYAKRSPMGVVVLPYGLDTLRLTGKEQRQFVLKGPLFAANGELTPANVSATGGRGFGISEALAGEASLGWEGAQYVGLVAGPSDFRAKLAGGIVNIGPLDIPVSEGRLKTAPRVLLNSPTPAIVVERGPLIENVRISPEMCSLWLKYVAPLVAEATRAEGKFSLSLEGGSVPIADPVTSDITGTLAIHQAQIGPGPLAQQYLGMAQQVRALFDTTAGTAAAASAAPDPNRGWLILPQQDVPFEVRQGVVHHHGLKMTVKDVVITTEGSVGIETQQINLLASIPVQESWLNNDRKLAFLKGQTIKIPVRGTLSKPQLDGKVIENLGKQLVGSVVQGQLDRQVERGQELLQKQLNSGFNKLFGPLQPQPAPVQPQPGVQPSPMP